VSGQAAAGRSSGAAIAEMERIASHVLTGNLTYEWTGTALEEKQAGGQIGMLLGLSLIVVFLLLAALYESWAIPVSVLLIIPFGVIGAVVLTMLRGLSADVYFNIGLVTIIGLAAKNAILIVEFAVVNYRGGMSISESALRAARVRFRPIVMTALAFIFGCLPLWTASGSGAEARRILGTVVIGGMTLATLIGILMVPVTFSVVEYVSHRFRKGGSDTDFDTPHPPEATSPDGRPTAPQAQGGEA
jgi:multidrug efflux pump